jgi:hypothetical protein
MSLYVGVASEKQDNMKNNIFLSMWLLAAMTLSGDRNNTSMQAHNEAMDLFSDSYKTQLYNEIMHDTVPVDALAQPDTSHSTCGEVDLDNLGMIALYDLDFAIAEDKNNAGMVFTVDHVRYKVKATDIVDLYQEQKKVAEKINPALEIDLIISRELEYKVACEYGDNHMYVSIDADAFRHTNKKGLLGSLVHEAAHVEDEWPADNVTISAKDSMAVIRKNEFAADRRAAELTSPDHMITALRQLAVSLRDETAKQNLTQEERDTINVRRFGFTRTPKEIHPSVGRRIQYLKQIELYQAGKITNPQPPPEQAFTIPRPE